MFHAFSPAARAAGVAVLWLMAACATAPRAGGERFTSVRTTPGLRPEMVAPLLEEKLPELGQSCARLVQVNKTPERDLRVEPLSLPSDADDRLLVVFDVLPDGSVVDGVRGRPGPDVRGLFVDTNCVWDRVRSWRFPAFSGEAPVHVEWEARFSTTEQERQARLAALHAQLDALCAGIEARAAGDVDAVDKAVRKALGGTPPPLEPVKRSLEAVLNAGPMDKATILRAAAQEVAYPGTFCPDLDRWKQQFPWGAGDEGEP